jgi:hypothetical protein
MDQYYTGAMLNIPASNAPDSSSSIFDTSNERRNSGEDIAIVNCSSAFYNVSGNVHLWSPSGKDWQTPLSLRAWVLQESILSPRVLCYDADQLRWNCNTTSWAEEASGKTTTHQEWRPSAKRLFHIQLHNEVVFEYGVSLSGKANIFDPSDENHLYEALS